MFCIKRAINWGTSISHNSWWYPSISPSTPVKFHEIRIKSPSETTTYCGWKKSWTQRVSLPVVPHKAVAEVFKNRKTYRRGWLLRIRDGRAKPLMDRKVLEVSSLSLTIYLPTYLSIYLSVYLCYLFIYRSISLSLPSNYLSIYLSVCLSIYLSLSFICQSV